MLRGADALVEGRVTNQTVNLAHGRGETLVDLVNIASLVLGKEAQVQYEPSRVGEVTRYVADISMARQLLGYEPEVPLSAGLPRAIAWYQTTGALSGA